MDFVSASTGALLSQASISGPGGLTIDSNNNLYMSHLYGPSVLKIPYVNGAYATLTDVFSGKLHRQRYDRVHVCQRTEWRSQGDCL